MSASRTLLYREFLNENANLSAKNRTEMIILSYSFRQENLLICTLFILALFSLLCLILLYFVFRNKEIRRIFSLIHLDLKFLLIFGFINYIVTSLNSFAFFAYQTLILLIDFHPSFYIWQGSQCYLSQIFFVSVCPQISLLIFVSIFLERLYISIGFKSNGTFGFLLSLLSILLPIGVYFNTSDPSHYEYNRIFCGSALTTFRSRTVSGTYIVIIFDFAISLFDFLLLLYNKRKIKSYRKQKGFNLDKSFNLKSIELSILFIYPISLANSITFCSQLIIYSSLYIKYAEYTTLINGILLFEASNFGRVGSNFIVIGTVWILNWKERKTTKIATFNGSTAADEYFRQFKAMIA